MTVQSLQVRVCRSWTEIGALRDDWEKLLHESTNPSLFLSHQWQEAWFDAYQELGELFVLTVTNDSDKLVGVLPAYRAIGDKPLRLGRPLRTLRVLGSNSGGTCTNLGVVARLEDGQCVGDALADYLVANPGEWDEVDLHFVLSEDPATRSFLSALRERGCVGDKIVEPHRIVHLPSSYDEFLAGLSKKMRTEIPYEERRIQRTFAVSFHRAETHDERRASTQALIEMNDKRWHARGEPGSFSTPQKRTLAESVGRRFLDLGWLDLWELRLDGRPAAIEFGFRFGDTFFPLWVAIDTEFIKFEVGSVLRAHIIRHVIGLGLTKYEFMRGRETYKMRWGATELEYQSVTLTKVGTYGHRLRRAGAFAADGKRRANKQLYAALTWTKAHVPEPYWNRVRDLARKILRRESP